LDAHPGGERVAVGGAGDVGDDVGVPLADDRAADIDGPVGPRVVLHVQPDHPLGDLQPEAVVAVGAGDEEAVHVDRGVAAPTPKQKGAVPPQPDEVSMSMVEWRRVKAAPS
jgi:hypothetical protein